MLLSLCLLLPVTAQLHPGSTDSKGGHIDNSTGEYHYHHGYPAHQHEDLDGDGVLDCPYDFVDKTGENSGGPSSSTTRGRNEYLMPTPSPTPSPQRSFRKLLNILGNILAGFLQCLWALGALSMFVIPIVCEIKKKKAEKDRFIRYQQEEKARREQERKEENERRQKEEAQQNIKRLQAEQQFIKERNKYFSLYAGKSLLEACNAPVGCYISDDGLPASRTGLIDKWGSKYTFYVSRSRKYHKASCMHGKNGEAINAFTLREDLKSRVYYQKSPCGLCKPVLPDLSWYDEYLRIKAIVINYRIDCPVSSSEETLTIPASVHK